MRPWILVAGALVLIAAGVAVAMLAGGGATRHAVRRGGTVGSGTVGSATHGPSPGGGPPSPGTQVPAVSVNGPPPLGPPGQPAPSTEQFGASVNRLFNDRAYTPAQIGAQLAALRQSGATVARSDALWELTEASGPENGVHHYDWSFDDLVAGSLASHGLQWLPILDYSAAWAESVAGQDHSPPRSASAFASFAAAFAARYGSGGTFWRERPSLRAEPVDTYEIWNEPDNQEFWVPVPNAAQYVDLYLSARVAITAVDPAARVIVGGLTNISRFLPAMLQGRPDLAGHIDGVAIHPYAPNPLLVLARVRGARSVLVSLGMSSVPLYVTEFGWTTRPAGAQGWAPARLRPSYIAATIDALGHVDCGIAATILYTWLTPERNPADPQDWFGIHPPSGASTADTSAFAASLARGKTAGANRRAVPVVSPDGVGGAVPAGQYEVVVVGDAGGERVQIRPREWCGLLSRGCSCPWRGWTACWESGRANVDNVPGQGSDARCGTLTRGGQANAPGKPAGAEPGDVNHESRCSEPGIGALAHRRTADGRRAATGGRGPAAARGSHGTGAT